MAEIKEKIEELVNRHLKEEHLFLVDVQVAGGRNASKITVLIDSDKGINIDECAALSRSLSGDIEELNLIEDKYTLDVSSPGLDQPLRLQRQYQKNLGREVKVLANDGNETRGKLKSVNEEGIFLEKKPLKKKKETVEEFIGFDKIKYTKVLISFK